MIPLDPTELAQHPELTDLADRLAESAAGAFLLTIGGLDLAHFPQRSDEPEVDDVLTVGTSWIPVEIKYRRRVDWQADTEGLRSFIERKHYNSPFGLLITQEEVEAQDPRIVALPLSSLLLLR